MAHPVVVQGIVGIEARGWPAVQTEVGTRSYWSEMVTQERPDSDVARASAVGSEQRVRLWSTAPDSVAHWCMRFGDAARVKVAHMG